MSKTDGAERVITKEVDVKRGGGEQGKSIQEELYERREAVEKHRQEQEKPRKDFLSGKAGKASDYFDVTTNRETVEKYVDQTGAPEEVENLSESAREKWLRTGELPEKKPNGKAAERKAEAAKPPERPKLADYRDENGEVKHEDYEKALDKYEADKTAFDKQEADAKNAEPKKTEQEKTEPTQEDREVLAEVERESETWHTEPAHAEAMKTFPQRWQAMQAALTPEQKSQVEASVKAIGQTIPADLNRFVLGALARTKNMGAVYVELMRQPGLLLSINHDWMRSANWQKSPDALKLRINTDKAIRHMLKVFDRRAGSATNGTGEKSARKLTQAGKPFLESAGASSSPADDGSSEAAWKRKDLTQDERGELYRTRKNAEESARRRRRR